MTTNVIITFTAKHEKLAEFTEILNRVKLDLPKVEGCISVSVFNDIKNPCVFTLVETWQSESTHKKHIDSVVSSGNWNHIALHLACDPSSAYFKAL